MSPRKPKPGQDEHAKQAGEKVAEEAAEAKAEAAEESARESAKASEEQVAEEEESPAEEAEAPKAEADDAPEAEAPEDDEPEAEDDDEPEAEADDEPEAEASEDGEAKPARRRGSAETGAGTRRKRAPKRVDGEVVVRARAKYVRSAPRKARLVMNHIRGQDVEQARAMLNHAPRAVSGDILKLLDSAVANAESNYELGADELRITKAFVDEGPTIKRYRPRALGRATRILKRTSHMTIELTNGTR
jgi:ribosomal protein L22